MRLSTFFAHLTASLALAFVVFTGSGVAKATGIECNMAEAYNCNLECTVDLDGWFNCCNIVSSGKCCNRTCFRYYCDCPGGVRKGPYSKAGSGDIIPSTNNCSQEGRCVWRIIAIEPPIVQPPGRQ